MDEDKRKRLQEKLAAVRIRYTESLPKQMADMQQAWRVLQRQPQNGTLLGAMHHQAHSLAGTAGTFGFDAMGKVARQIEILLKDMMAGKETVVAKKQAIHDLLDRLVVSDKES